MHVKLHHTDGEWHRVMIDRRHPAGGRWGTQSIIGARTACDITIGNVYYAMREECYQGRLCTAGCFTPAEFRVAEELRLADEQLQLEDAERFDIERAEHHRRLQEHLKQNVDQARYPDVDTAPAPPTTRAPARRDGGDDPDDQ